MRANIKNLLSEFSINPSHRKENWCCDSYLVCNTDFEDIIDCRIYTSPKHGVLTVYCCIWINVKGKDGVEGIHLGTSDSATGYGYCKRSAAVYMALDKIGIKFSKCFSGSGMHDVEDALLALGRQLTNRKIGIVKAFA